MMRWWVLCACLVGAASGAGINWLAIGDWGGTDHPPYTEPGEVASAKGMGKIGADLDSKFVLAMGDNFYGSGIHGNAHNSRFEQTFEDVFTASALQTPWYVIAGNHDHLGNVSAEIAYTKLSKRWTYPDEYYGWTESFTSETESGEPLTTTVQFLFFDTVVAAGMSYHDEDTNTFVDPTGPANKYKADEQWTWLEKQMSTSTADYLWVGGHYPVWSICSHGPTSELVSKLKPMLEKYNATGYLSGHDHCQEYLDEGKGPVYVLTGNGDNCCYSPSNKDKVPSGSLKFHKASDNSGDMTGGFAAFKATSESIVVTFYDQDGKEQYTTPAIKPRNH